MNKDASHPIMAQERRPRALPSALGMILLMKFSCHRDTLVAQRRKWLCRLSAAHNIRRFIEPCERSRVIMNSHGVRAHCRPALLGFVGQWQRLRVVVAATLTRGRPGILTTPVEQWPQGGEAGTDNSDADFNHGPSGAVDIVPCSSVSWQLPAYSVGFALVVNVQL